MTKEQIIEGAFKMSGSMGSDAIEYVWNDIEQYAKQEAIAFAEWCDANYYNEDGSNNELIPFEVKYQLFTQSKQQ